MKKHLKLSLLVAIFSFFMFEGISYAAVVAKFMLIDGMTDAALADRTISVYEGATVADFDYNNKESQLFIKEVTTNKKGSFTLKQAELKGKTLVLNLGAPYGVYKIGRTSDPKKSFTEDGIWITNFDAKGHLVSNQFYNLKRKRMKFYVSPFTFVGEEKFSEIRLRLFPKR